MYLKLIVPIYLNYLKEIIFFIKKFLSYQLENALATFYITIVNNIYIDI